MLTRTVRLTGVCVFAAALSAGGCNGSHADQSARGQGSGARAGGGGVGGEFETTRDPPIANETRRAAGELAESRGAYAQAAEQYKYLLRKNPGDLRAMYRLGVVYAQMKNYPEAIATWKNYVRATNDSAAAYGDLAFCYELANKPQDAEANYLKAIAKDPRHVPSRVNYGLMLVRQGREAEARPQLEAVLKPAEVHYNVGAAYEALGRKEQAKIEYAKALETDPSMADAQARLAALRATAPATSPAKTQPAAAEAGVSQTELAPH